jgi:hypothetical protein
MIHKYRAISETVDGHKFPSKAEARRYRELKLLQAAGKIRGLELQPVFKLVSTPLSAMRPSRSRKSNFMVARKVRKATILDEYIVNPQTFYRIIGYPK